MGKRLYKLSRWWNAFKNLHKIYEDVIILSKLSQMYIRSEGTDRDSETIAIKNILYVYLRDIEGIEPWITPRGIEFYEIPSKED